jgi:hypothetical protein
MTMCYDMQSNKSDKDDTKSIMLSETNKNSNSNSESVPDTNSDSYFNSYNCLQICKSRMKSLREYKIVCIVIHSFQLYILYFFWIILHSFGANAYVYFCAHPSVYGVIHSFLFSQSPHCKMLFFLTDVGSQMINAVWISVGLWLVNTITKKYPKIIVRNDYLPSKSSIAAVEK